jgi:hypothetical protein
VNEWAPACIGLDIGEVNNDAHLSVIARLPGQPQTARERSRSLGATTEPFTELGIGQTLCGHRLSLTRPYEKLCGVIDGPPPAGGPRGHRPKPFCTARVNEELARAFAPQSSRWSSGGRMTKQHHVTCLPKPPLTADASVCLLPQQKGSQRKSGHRLLIESRQKEFVGM